MFKINSILSESIKAKTLAANTAATSSKEAGAGKYHSFKAMLDMVFETPGYMKAMVNLINGILSASSAEKIHLKNEEKLAFQAKVSLIYEGYVADIIRTHLLDSAKLRCQWEFQEVASLLNGYKSQALREAEASQSFEKVAFYRLASFCERKENIRKLTKLMNKIFRDLWEMEDLGIEGFEAILASKYSKLF